MFREFIYADVIISIILKASGCHVLVSILSRSLSVTRCHDPYSIFPTKWTNLKQLYSMCNKTSLITYSCSRRKPTPYSLTICLFLVENKWFWELMRPIAIPRRKIIILYFQYSASFWGLIFDLLRNLRHVRKRSGFSYLTTVRMFRSKPHPFPASYVDSSIGIIFMPQNDQNRYILSHIATAL